MTNRQAKLIEEKSITRWITGADKWIRLQSEKINTGDTPVTNWEFTVLSTDQKQMFDQGVKDWARHEHPTQIKMCALLSTKQGALAGIAYVNGLRAAAFAQWQTVMDWLSEHPPKSSSDGMMDKAIANCHEEIPASKSGSSPAKP